MDVIGGAKQQQPQHALAAAHTEGGILRPAGNDSIRAIGVTRLITSTQRSRGLVCLTRDSFLVTVAGSVFGHGPGRRDQR